MRNPGGAVTQTVNGSSQPRPLNNFDSLRLLLAIFVVFSHSYPVSQGSNDAEPIARINSLGYSLGTLSVWGFFTISGFLIAQSYLRTSRPLAFMGRRFRRIYPAFIGVSLISALVVVPAAADPSRYHPPDVWNFLTQTSQLRIFEYPPIFVNNAKPDILNDSLWSVPFEFWCYIGVFVLGLTGLLRKGVFILAAFVAATVWHVYLAAHGLTPTDPLISRVIGYPIYWSWVLPFFLAGMLFCVYGERAWLQPRFAAFAALLIFASNFAPYGLIVTLPTCGSYILLWLADLPALNPLNLGRFGDFSYGTYLYAYPIQQLIVMHFGGRMDPLVNFALALPLALGAGVLSWFLVERPFLSAGSQLRREGRSGAP